MYFFGAVYPFLLHNSLCFICLGEYYVNSWGIVIRKVKVRKHHQRPQAALNIDATTFTVSELTLTHFSFCCWRSNGTHLFNCTNNQNMIDQSMDLFKSFCFRSFFFLNRSNKVNTYFAKVYREVSLKSQEKK